MSKERRIGSYVMVAAGILVLLGWNSGPRAEEKMTLGVINMGRLFDEYKEYQQANRDYQVFRQELVNLYQESYNQREQHYLLTSEQWEKLQTLLRKENPSEEDKKQIKELRSITSQLSEELVGLQQKQELTEPEKARRKELTDKHKAGMQALDELSKDFDRQVKEKLNEHDNEVSAKLRAKIDAMIARVAQESGLTMVFNSDSVLFGGTDITDQVVNKLNEENPVELVEEEKQPGQEEKKPGEGS